MISNGSNASMGTLMLTQNGDKVQITGSLTGLGGSAGKRGISVCTHGNLSSGAQSCGPIFNPFGRFRAAFSGWRLEAICVLVVWRESNVKRGFGVKDNAEQR